MITVNVQFEVDVSGDGENHTDIFAWPTNGNAPPPTKVFVNGDTVVPVPPNAAGVFIKIPTTASPSIRAVVGDAPILLTAGKYLAWRFVPNAPPASFVLSNVTASATWTLIWC